MTTPTPTAPQGPDRHAWLGRLVQLRDGEGSAVLVAWLYFFSLMCGYSILKPLRDEMAAGGKTEKLPWLFTGTFAVMLIAVPLYSALVARIPRHRVLPLVYRFFLVNLLVFFALLRLRGAAPWVAGAFFVWTSVYNLFIVSVFWSFMADLFKREQGKRLFGFIAAGGTAGMIIGPGITALLAKPLGPVNLLLVSAVLLELSAQCVRRLARWGQFHTASPAAAGNDAPVGGGMFAGFKLLVRSPYLLGLGAQTFLYTATSTLLYVLQTALVKSSISDPAQRTQLFASMDLAINVLTLLLQTVVTGRLIQRVGLAVVLGIIPAVTAFGFVGLAFAPVLWLLVGFKTARNSAHYALERPAREILFTVVDREEKYKTKSFLDTVVYRGSDTLTSWLGTALVARGLGLSSVAITAVPLAAAWLAVSLYLARRQEARARQELLVGVPFEAGRT